MPASPTATAAARALLNRDVRDRANAYGGSQALGIGWEEYLLPRVVGTRRKDTAGRRASRRGAGSSGRTRQSRSNARRAGCGSRTSSSSSQKTGRRGSPARTRNSASIPWTPRKSPPKRRRGSSPKGGPLAQAVIAALAPPETPAVDGYILTPRRILNDLILDGVRPSGMPRPRLPDRARI